MGLIIITIIILIISIILIIYGRRKYNIAEYIGVSILACVIITGVIEGVFLITKPVYEIEFKSKYQAVKEIENNKDDMRDTNYTNNLIEINKTVTTQRIMINNKWIGIFYSKEIANLDLLGKEE